MLSTDLASLSITTSTRSLAVEETRAGPLHVKFEGEQKKNWQEKDTDCGENSSK